MDVIPLTRMNPGERGTIYQLNVDAPALRHRLLEIGLVTGTTVRVVRFAPLGDPIELDVRGCRLSMRRQEAQNILIRKLPQ